MLVIIRPITIITIITTSVSITIITTILCSSIIITWLASLLPPGLGCQALRTGLCRFPRIEPPGGTLLSIPDFWPL